MGGYWMPARRRAYQPSDPSAMIQLIMRRGEIQAERQRAMGQAIADAIRSSGRAAGEAINQWQQQKQLRAREEAFNTWIDSGEWQKDPETAMAGCVKMFGPQKGPEVFQNLYGNMQLARAKDREEAMSGLQASVRGMLAADEGSRPVMYRTSRQFAARAGLLTPEQANDPNDEYGPDKLPMLEALAGIERPKKPPKQHVVTAEGIRAFDPETGQLGDVIGAAPPRIENPENVMIGGRATVATPSEMAAAKARGEAVAPYQAPRQVDPVAAELARLRLDEARSRQGMRASVEALPPEWKNAANRASLSMPAQRRAEFDQTVAALAGDKSELADYIRQAAIEGENVDVKNQIMGRQATMASLRDAASMLQEMKAKGVPTDYLTGNMEDVARRLGTSTNPEYVALGNRLMGTLINYRRAATGVQFSERESADYQRMFPNYRNTLPVNEALISGLLREMETYDRVYWEHKLGKNGARVVGVGGGGPGAPTGAAQMPKIKSIRPVRR